MCSPADVEELLRQIDVSDSSSFSDVFEATKVLRGLVGKDPVNFQPTVLTRQDFIVENFKAQVKLCQSDSIQEKDLRISLQLIHNLCVKQPEFCAKVWNELSQEITDFLSSSDCRTVNVISALLLQLALNDCAFAQGDLLTVFRGLLSSIATTPEAESPSGDFPFLALQKFLHLLDPSEIDAVVTDLSENHRQILYEVLSDENRESMPETLLTYVVGEFKKRATLLFITLKSRPDVDPREVITLLDIICGCAYMEQHRGVLQQDKSLLIDTLYLLRMVHESGRENSGGMFGPKPKLDDVRDEGGRMSSDPVFGFKRDLVRLLANLCYQHKDNQEEVRENRGIELLLDCSQADGRNPLITQWVVLAVRNLCEDNLANQEVIRSIETKGKMDNDMMDKIGVQIKQL